MTDPIIVRSRLKYYLGMFFVEPFPKDSPILKRLQTDFHHVPPYDVLSYLCSSPRELKQVAQAIILMYKHSVRWEAFNSFELVDRFLQGESVLSITESPELLIVYHGIKEMPNRQLHNITNQAISNRRLKSKRTLFLTAKPDSGFDFPIHSLYGSADGSDSASSSCQVNGI